MDLVAPFRPGPLPWAGAAFAAVLGLGLGIAGGHVFWTPPPGPAAVSRPLPSTVSVDPSTLVIQPGDLGPGFTLFVESPPPDPAATHPSAQYGVVVRRPDQPAYLAESDVSLYGSPERAAAALRAVLAVGKFGAALPLHAPLGAEGHLFAARDAGIVVGSAVWRDRDAVCWVFVYSPYPDGVPDTAVEAIARANAYDEVLAYAAAVEARVAAA